jgi:hypothetical protein
MRVGGIEGVYVRLTGYVWALAVLSIPAAYGQAVTSVQANIRGGGGDGKCTFEVVVDGAAEVQIRGEQGTLRTLSGAPARWVRLDCNQPLPPNPREFRFQGIDGRGSQRLVRDPRNNRGTAAVRIDDSKGGSEGYTGDIIWRGDGGNWSPGYGGGRPPGIPGYGGGWNGQNGSTFNYRGDGNGSFVQRNGPNTRVRDVNVSLARNGAIYLAFQAPGYRGRLDFSGRAMRFNRDSVDATLNGPGEMRANAMIYVNRDGSVDRIDMSGRGRDGDFRLNWRSR